ncbi:hypothetical protein J31TS4_01210 [Paenibacillus sp. J31TS4]|uniref:hypothetical protein n=1 Tax=Paenibacillus sp. J31TS4 TaxID=2807195 RepID=UPI001B19792F|nr:hypothetical protein [Paenibacillus sp. J31TS4]GIP36841.1 hypothetical protein J31TS4_01210 [Paenibacillus sp. J31TS4]
MSERRKAYWTGIGLGIMLGAVLLQAVYAASGNSSPADEQRLRQQAEAAGYRLAPLDETRGAGASPPQQSPSPSAGAGTPPASSVPPVGPSAQPPATPSAPAASVPAAAAPASPAATAPAPPAAPQASAPPAASQAPAGQPPAAPSAPPAATAPSPVQVTIAPGSTGWQVVDAFVQAGLVSDRQAFEDLLLGRRLQTKIRSGTYSFVPGETAEAMIDRITAISK